MDRMESLAGRHIPRAVTDTALALVLAAVCMALPIAMPPDGPELRAADAQFFVLVLLATLPLAVHRFLPLPALLVMAVSAGMLQGLHYVPELSGPQGTSIGPTYAAVAAAVFLTATRSTPRIATLVVSVFIPAAAVTEAVLAPGGHRIAALFTDAVLLVAAWALGRLTRARAAVRDQALERAAALEREQAANARAAVMEERARIARELHDIVAHNVSLMVVQTIAADRVQERDAAKAHELHGTIEETGRATVTELRRLLDVLRTDEEAEGDPSKEPPQPTLDSLPALVDSVRAAGLEVDYSTSGTPAELPAGSHLTVYRVVQEALTNTLKHAGRTRTALRVAWEPEHARLTVRLCDDGPLPDGERTADGRTADGRTDDAPVRPPVVAHGAGHGLVGMRERVGAVGGSLHTGARPGGGYCVHAVIPLPAQPPASATAPASASAPASSPEPRHEGHSPYADHPRPAGR